MNDAGNLKGCAVVFVCESLFLELEKSISDVAAKVQDNRCAGEDNRVSCWNKPASNCDGGQECEMCRYRGLYCQLLQCVCRYNPSDNLAAEHLSVERTSILLYML